MIVTKLYILQGRPHSGESGLLGTLVLLTITISLTSAETRCDLTRCLTEPVDCSDLERCLLAREQRGCDVTTIGLLARGAVHNCLYGAGAVCSLADTRQCYTDHLLSVTTTTLPPAVADIPLLLLRFLRLAVHKLQHLNCSEARPVLHPMTACMLEVMQRMEALCRDPLPVLWTRYFSLRDDNPFGDGRSAVRGIIQTLVVGLRRACPNDMALSMFPRSGPVAGGTDAIISGNIPRSISPSLQVKIAYLDCVVQGRSSLLIYCRTPPLTLEAVGGLLLPVHFETSSGVIPTALTFRYGPNPSVTRLYPLETIVSGHTMITLKAASLQFVATPVLQVTIDYAEPEKDPMKWTFSTACEGAAVGGAGDADDEEYLCSLPSLVNPAMYDFGAVPRREARAAQPGPTGQLGMGRRAAIPGPRSRRRRGACGVEAASGSSLSNMGINSSVVMVMDGLRTESQTFRMYTDPIVYRFQEEANVRVYRPFRPFGDTFVDIKGANLTTGLQCSDFRVTIGTGQCMVSQLSVHSISCHPPDRQPRAANHHGIPEVKVFAGPLVFSVGNLRYEHSWTEHEPFLWTIITGVLGLMSLVTITSVLCCTWYYPSRTRRNARATSTIRL